MGSAVALHSSPFSRCRCTSCRDDVVTMAAKLRKKARDTRERESKKTNPVEGMKEGGEREKGKGPEVTWPSNLRSSLHAAANLGLRSSYCRGTKGSASIPLIPIDLSVWATVRQRLTDSIEVQKLHRHLFLTSSFRFFSVQPPLLHVMDVGGRSLSLSLNGSSAGTLLNVNFAKGCMCVSVTLATCSDRLKS